MALAARLRLASSLNRLSVAPTRQFATATASVANHDAEEAKKWRLITACAVVACFGLGLNVFLGHEEHHEHERPAYPYMHIRNKEFPWGPDGLFEYHHQ